MSLTNMAAIGALTDLQKSDKYHRTLSLNFDCGSDALRRTVDTHLNNIGKTLHLHMTDKNVQNKITQLKKAKMLYPEQVKLLTSKSPDLECMDVTLLTTVLLELFPVTNIQEKNLRALKKKRNYLAHRPKTMLDDDVPFIEASSIILALASDISDEFKNKMNQRIEELKNRELVCTRSNMDVVLLNGEALMVKLVESDGINQVDENNETWIKLGLTKYVRQLARSLEVDLLLQDLKDAGVIYDTLKREIEKLYNYEEQMQLLVLHMLDETRENLLKFCTCLQKRNSLLADLVQHKECNVRELELSVKKEEHQRIIQILKDGFDEDRTNSLACEDIHMYVESKRKCPSSFKTVHDCIKECFPNVFFEENDSRFRGITAKERNNLYFNEDKVATENTEEVLTNMPCDKFGEYLSLKMDETRNGIGCHFEKVVVEECISSKLFGKLTDELMQSLFEPPLKEANIKYGFGIKNALSDIRKNIFQQMNRESPSTNGKLRPFDKPVLNTTYTRCSVKPPTGNLLTPAHEFVFPVFKKQLNKEFIAKEVVRFATACLNGKKNGTIHFGIRDALNGTGDVIGLSKDEVNNVELLNRDITLCIKSCFKITHQRIAERCIRPVQCIPVEDSFFVLEVDVVPFSGLLSQEIISIKFPPKGTQREKCFAYEGNTVLTIDESRIDSVVEDFKALFEERIHLETEVTAPIANSSARLTKKLQKLLTGGNRFVTDVFTPVIFTGNISGCPDEENIRENISKMSVAFTSAMAVFDFDFSVDLRYQIEMDNDYFQVRLPEDFNTKRTRRESDFTGDSKIWLYSNGNVEVGKEKMDTETWYSKRLEGVQSALYQVRQQIPAKRGILIFLVFQNPIEQDPMLEIARETFLKSFKDECIVITEDDSNLQDWRREMRGRISKQDFEEKIISGLSWDEVTLVVKNAFRPSKNVLYKFPDSKGQIVDMTSKEHDELRFQTIEIVDGYAHDNCRIQEEEDDDIKCKARRLEEEETFYKGNEVSWWNFFYSQVGQRSSYDLHNEEIGNLLLFKDSVERYATYQLRHHPGAGGSTLARHIIWHFSQMKRTPERSYRCCIVQRITEDTAEEIYRFKTFKDQTAKRPIIVLVDNKNEESLNNLRSRIDEISYKKGSPGNLFCLILIVTRVTVSYQCRADIVLKHNLTKEEKRWFTKKYEKLESMETVDVNTLIAFNVMRHSFNVHYINDTTERLFKEVTKQEKMLLEVLSLICSFDSDSPVPESVFDSLMRGVDQDPKYLTLEQCVNKPYGLVWSEKERRAKRHEPRETWNVTLTGSMQLFITHRRLNSDARFGVCILSMPLSKSIMEHIMLSENKSFEDIVNNVLDLLEQHNMESNPMSKMFVKIVCSLFTYREPITEKGETKVSKFSALVLNLEKQLPHESAERAHSRVIQLMERCFDLSRNAMVGQQLARYHYLTLKDYKAAENVVKRCLKIQPQNTYLLDTYGQIYKANIEQIIGKKSEGKMNDEQAAEFIELGLKAIDKFRRAQEALESYEDFNRNSFLMEVVTALDVLENCHKFECYTDEESIRSFLNNANYDLRGSPYENVVRIAPGFEQLRNGADTQRHIERSLRIVEEKAYMTREHLAVVHTQSKDVLLLTPRKRFEKIYGSEENTLHFEFLFGVGLKKLMKAYNSEESNALFTRRVRDARCRLQHDDKTEFETDLLVTLGYSIIEISNKISTLDISEYRRLLNYSTMLWNVQREKKPKVRHYVEAYLYYALLHWLTPRREDSGVENLSSPDTYKDLLKQWELVYMQNMSIKKRDQLYKEAPKIYFALGNGTAGNDIIDLEWLRHKWREAMRQEGRHRKEVKADNHWHHPIFEECLLRLHGTVDGSGKWIDTEVQFNHRTYPQRVHTYENQSGLSNRAVTFVLAFSWMAPIALDVRKIEKSVKRQNSHTPTGGMEKVKEHLVNDRAVTTVEKEVVKQRNKQTNNTEKVVIKRQISNAHKGQGHSAKDHGISIAEKERAEQQRKQTANTEKVDIKRQSSHTPKGQGHSAKDHGISIAEKERAEQQRKQTANTDTVQPSMKTEASVFGRNRFEVLRPDDSEESPRGAEGNTTDLVDDDDGSWIEVGKKKKPVVRIEQKRKPESAPMHVPSNASPKERFEALILRCQEKYPHKSRMKIVQAYNIVKELHHGLKGITMEQIVEEIGYHL